MDVKIGSGELNTKKTFSEQLNLSDHSNNLSGLIEYETNQVIMSNNESDTQEKMSLNSSNQVFNIQMVNSSFGGDFPEKSQIIPESYDNIKIIATKNMTGADYVNENFLELMDSAGQNYLHIDENPVNAVSNNVNDPARTSDIKNDDAKSTINELKSLISQQAAEIEKLLDLNKGLQEKVLDKMDEYGCRQINPYSCRIKGDIPVGYIRTDTNQKYCGNGVWMNLAHYYQTKNNAAAGKPNTEYSRFVKTAAEFIFGKDELARCSVKGQRCNAVKGSVAKPALDTRKLSAVHENKSCTQKKKSAAPPNSKNAKKPTINVSNDKDPENSMESETANTESSESSDDGSDDEMNEESVKESDKESDKEIDNEDAESSDGDSSADDDSSSSNSEHE
uniref:BEN domain-containing protein n=1 Tax=Trichogramma kaykai TaxID=54128 RepID=A0ABD2WBD1_9HYME